MTIRILRPLAHGLFALVALICASLAPVVHAAAPEKTKLTIGLCNLFSVNFRGVGHDAGVTG